MRIILNFFSPPIFEHDQEKTRQAGMLFRALQIAWAVPFAAVVASLLVHANATLYLPIGIGMAIVIVAMNFMMRQGHVRPTSMVFITILLIFSGYADFIQGGEVRNVTVLISVTVVAAGLLLGGRSAIIAAAVLTIEHGVFVWAATQGLIQSIAPQATPITNFLVVSIAYMMVAFNFAVASNSLNTALARAQESEQELAKTNQDLEKRVADRTTELNSAVKYIERRAKQFEAITQVSRVISQTQNLQDILPQITQVISQQFNYYHVGIFMLDTQKEYAILSAANSEGGQRMLDRHHKMRVGQVGIVGNVAESAKPRIALDTGADAVYFNNPDLPETRSEMALPLMQAEGQIIGILDIQSIEPNAFNLDNIEILTALAAQVAVAISNARLYEETQRNLLESEILYRRDLQSGWEKFTRAQKIAGVRRAGIQASIYTDSIDLPGADEVHQSGSTYVNVDKEAQSQVTIPVKLRGEMIGMLNIKTDEERKWTGDEMDIITAIVERAAFSIENARLLAESRKIAEKERIVSEISAKVSAYTNRDNILQAAVTEIGRTLPGVEVILQLQSNNKNDADTG